MAITQPEIIDHLTSLGSSPGITPSPGANRLYLICDIAETNATGVMTAVTVGGVSATIIHQFATATMNFYLYYLDEVGIQAMVGTDIVRTGGSLSASFITRGVVFRFVDQTTPFVNVEDQGYSGTAANSTGTINFTLDEIVDGLGVLFGGNSKTTGTWTYGSYTEYTTPATDGSNMAAVFATKATSAVAASVVDSLVNSLPGDKTCAVAVMLQPGDDAGTPPPSDPGSTLELGSFEGVGTVAIHTGAGGVALTNQSDVAWSETLQNWLAVANSTGTIFKYNESDVYQGQITKSGNTTNDVEGITHYQGDEYLLCNENNQIWKVTIDATTTNVDLQVGSNQSYTLPARGLSNKGTEGVAVNPATGDVWAVQESDPMRIYHFVLPADKPDLTAYDHAVDLTVDEPFDPEIVLGGVILDMASIEYDDDTGNLIILSERSQIMVEVNPTDGSIIDRKVIPPDFEGGFTQPEGLAKRRDQYGRLYFKLWGEPNESQIWRKIILGGETTLEAEAAINISGRKHSSGSTSLSSSAGLALSGRKKASGTPNLDSVGAIAISGSKSSGGSIQLNASADSTASGTKRVSGAAGLSAVAEINVVGQGPAEGGDVELGAIASISNQGRKKVSGSSGLSAVASLSNAGGKFVESGSGVSSLSATASIANNGTKRGVGSVQQYSVASISAIGRKMAAGNIQLSARASINVSGASLILITLDIEEIIIRSTTSPYVLKSSEKQFDVLSSNNQFTIG